MSNQELDINHRIWQVVNAIPAGKVSTYGDVAQYAGLPGAARRAGAALRALPQGSEIPWHRVINAQGRLSFPILSERYTLQRSRLEAEGVEFSCKGRIDLSRFRW